MLGLGLRRPLDSCLIQHARPHAQRWPHHQVFARVATALLDHIVLAEKRREVGVDFRGARNLLSQLIHVCAPLCAQLGGSGLVREELLEDAALVVLGGDPGF